MFDELATIFDHGKKSRDLAETSQPSMSEIPQPPITATTSVVSSGTYSREGPNTSRSRLSRIFQEESQIQVLKAFFEICHYPISMQIRELSSSTKLTSDQIKRWFKNKRHREKVILEGNEISALREENNKFRAEVSRYKEALERTTCPHCGKSTTLGEMSLSPSSSFPMPSNFPNFIVGSSDIPQSSYVQDEDVTWLF